MGQNLEISRVIGDHITTLSRLAEHADHRFMDWLMPGNEVLELLRAPIAVVPPESERLSRYGVERVIDYAILTHGRLEEIVPDHTRRMNLERFMAKHYGVLVDTPFTEEHLRVVEGRPDNLYADPAMKALLLGGLDPVVGKLDVRDQDTLRIIRFSRRFPPSSGIVDGLCQNFNTIFYPAERDVPYNKFSRNGWSEVAGRVQHILREIGLWAPIVWTTAERARRIELGVDEEHAMRIRIDEIRRRHGKPTS